MSSIHPPHAIPLRIVIPDDFPPAFAGTAQLEELGRFGKVTLYDDRARDQDELRSRLSGAAVLVNVRSTTALDAELLEALPELAHIAVFGAGTDNVDLDAATRLGILVTNAPGANARSVAEHAIALALAVARSIPLHDRDLRAGRWLHHEGIEFEGKTFGIVGLGQIGRHTARIAAGFGMRLLGWSTTHDEARAAELGVHLVELDDLLRQCDVVSLSLAVSDRTRGMIGAPEIALLKPTAILVNTARGALIDQPALIEALRDRRIFGAGLDVYAEEPLPAGDPLLTLPNVVLSPHAGWMTHEARQRLLRVPVENLVAWLAGHPTNVVNPAVLGHARPLPSP